MTCQICTRKCTSYVPVNALTCTRNSGNICSVKRGLKEYAKRIDPGQPAHSAQADLGLNFSSTFCMLKEQLSVRLSRMLQNSSYYGSMVVWSFYWFNEAPFTRAQLIFMYSQVQKVLVKMAAIFDLS